MLCVQLCFKCFGRPARTAVIDKPLLALVLAKLGFVPAITDRSVPVLVGRSDSGSNVGLYGVFDASSHDEADEWADAASHA